MIRRPPRSTRTDTLFPYTTLFRSSIRLCIGIGTPGLQRFCICGTGMHTVEPARHFWIRQIQASARTAEFQRKTHHAIGGCKAVASEIGTLSQFGFQPVQRSEEHTSELKSLMRLSHAAYRMKKKRNTLSGCIFKKNYISSE